MNPCPWCSSKPARTWHTSDGMQACMQVHIRSIEQEQLGRAIGETSRPRDFVLAMKCALEYHSPKEVGIGF